MDLAAMDKTAISRPQVVDVGLSVLVFLGALVSGVVIFSTYWGNRKQSEKLSAAIGNLRVTYAKELARAAALAETTDDVALLSLSVLDARDMGLIDDTEKLDETIAAAVKNLVVSDVFVAALNAEDAARKRWLLSGMLSFKVKEAYDARRKAMKSASSVLEQMKAASSSAVGERLGGRAHELLKDAKTLQNFAQAAVAYLEEDKLNRASQDGASVFLALSAERLSHDDQWKFIDAWQSVDDLKVLAAGSALHSEERVYESVQRLVDNAKTLRDFARAAVKFFDDPKGVSRLSAWHIFTERSKDFLSTVDSCEFLKAWHDEDAMRVMAEGTASMGNNSVEYLKSRLGDDKTARHLAQIASEILAGRDGMSIELKMTKLMFFTVANHELSQADDVLFVHSWADGTLGELSASSSVTGGASEEKNVQGGIDLSNIVGKIKLEGTGDPWNGERLSSSAIASITGVILKAEGGFKPFVLTPAAAK